MFYRFLFSFLVLISCTSCTGVSFTKSDKNIALDTIIDFTKVDVSPSFKICERLLDDAKTICFRNNIQQYFIRKLQNLSLVSESRVDENIALVLKIDAHGEVSLKELLLTETISKHFPKINIAIEKMVKNLPNLSPALKRGIPVNTEYTLPIHIVVE